LKTERIYTNIYTFLLQSTIILSWPALQQALSYIQGFLRDHRKYK
jgi:hypothetical protein